MTTASSESPTPVCFVKHHANFEDLTGRKYGMLTVVSYQHTKIMWKIYHSFWECMCECGKMVIRDGAYLRRGSTTSCGCIRGQGVNVKKHGMHKSGEYKSWAGMKDRCYNPKNSGWQDYGGRGISVCERWMSFQNFFEDMGLKPSPNHTVDRRNNDLGYFPGNCKWATKTEQANNRRNSRFVWFNGKQITIAQVCKLTGVNHQTLRKRLNKGQDMATAMRPAGQPLP